MKNKRNKTVTPIEKLAYGVGNWGCIAVSQMPTLYLMFFCTTILRLPGMVIGTALALSIAWDAVTDPIMGYISDNRSVGRFGKRHAYILIGSVGLAAVNYFIWGVNIDAPVYSKTIYVLAMLLLCKTFSTIFATPHAALGAEMTDDYNERTSLQSVKAVFFFLGMAMPSVLGNFAFLRATPEYPQGQLNPQGYERMALVFAVLTVVCGAVCVFFTRRFIVKQTASTPIKIPHKFWSSLLRPLKNRNFRSIAWGYTWTNVATALVMGMGMTVFTFTFVMSSKQIGTVSLLLMSMAILSQPLWVVLARVMDKKPAILLAIRVALGCMVFFLLIVVVRDLVRFYIDWLVYPFAVVLGVSMGGILTLPQSMLTDVIAVNEKQTGVKDAGLFSGGFTFFYKASQAIAMVLIGVMQDIVGFNTNKPIQSRFTLMALGYCMAIGLIAVMLVALFNYSRYGLTKEELDINKN